ncbi:MAG: serine hydrolase [Nitrospirota bacterium]
MKFGFERMTSRTRLAAAALFLLGCAAGFLLRGPVAGRPAPAFSEQREPGWEFINPLLECDQPRDTIEGGELKSIKRSVEDVIANRLNKKWADKVNVYFRELNDGPWFAIGDPDEFHPASLLKVPLMMAVLKQAEHDPALLKKKVSLAGPELKTIPNLVSKPLQLGRSYTVEELLRQMIVYSDNVATFVLGNTVDLTVITRTYSDLGLVNPYSRQSDPPFVMASAAYEIPIRSYSTFFRILFNASYLSREMSEKALRLLSETDFTSGLVAGVPPGIKIAHKWGTHLSGDHQEIKQLHDCGIVYYPEHPYMLCIMTSGPSLEYLDDAISTVSRVVYDSIDRQHQEPLGPVSP